MQAIRRFLNFILPSKAAVKAGTKQWLAECPCGHKRDLWDSGEMRYKATEEPKQLGHCSVCGKWTMQKIRKKTEAEKQEIP